jgi:hypothetical protein
VLVRIVSAISRQNILLRQLRQQRFMILFGINTRDESVRTCESVVFVFARETSRFSHRSDRVDMVRFSSLKRRTPERFALSR